MIEYIIIDPFGDQLFEYRFKSIEEAIKEAKLVLYAMPSVEIFMKYATVKKGEAPIKVTYEKPTQKQLEIFEDGQ